MQLIRDQFRLEACALKKVPSINENVNGTKDEIIVCTVPNGLDR